MLNLTWNRISGTFAASPAPADFKVNYVWVNKAPARFTGSEDEPLCSVPLSHLDKAFDNAERYPAADFTIWLDHALLDDPSQFFVYTHAYYNAPDNVTLRDLNEIDAYRSDPVFNPENDKSVWARADYARLLVCAQCFEDMTRQRLPYSRQTVLYSDFDVEDIRLDDPQITDKIKKYGLSFGEYKPYGSHYPENGYMAFRQGPGEDFLNNRLIPKTKSVAERNLNGWRTMVDVLRAWAREQGIDKFHKVLSTPIQPPRGTKIPTREVYKEAGLN